MINTYHIWLLYELFRGALTQEQHKKFEASLHAYVSDRLAAKPYLAYVIRPSGLFETSEPLLGSSVAQSLNFLTSFGGVL